MTRRRPSARSGAAIALLLFPLVAFGIDWKAVGPEDLALKAPRVEANADAECLFWDMWVADSISGFGDTMTTYTHYIRIKIFTDAGVQKYATVDVEYRGKERIGDVAGRTIQPDGSVIELKKDAIFNHAIEKGRHHKVQALSFAMPGVKPGSIIEYRYKRWQEGQLANYVPLDPQLKVPVERVTFHLKPFESPYSAIRMHYLPYHTQIPPFKRDTDGFFVSSMQNIPAFREEEDAPPARDVEPWVLIYYSEEHKESPDKFWNTEGKAFYAGYSPFIKVNGEVKQIADEVTSGAKTDDEKLAKLYAYCQKHIKNINGPDATDLDRKSFKPNRNTAETLKRGIGRQRELGLSFLALATAAGYDARMAYLMDREVMIFQKEAMIPILPIEDVAVKVGGSWRLYDPATRYVEPGHVRWQEEGTLALIADPKNPEFFNVPLTAAADSNRKQTGRIKLDADGNAEGDLTEMLSGHLAEEWRGENLNHSQPDREKSTSDEIKQLFPGAEVTALKVSDPADLAAPVSISFHLKMEGFCTRTGKRLFFSPAVFQANEAARYPGAKRINGVLMHYPWSETEDVSISLPDGFVLDHPDMPRPLVFQPVGDYTAKAIVMPGRVLFHREFEFGKDGHLYFPVSQYPALKKLFDTLHDNDTHAFALLQKATITATAAQ